MAKPKVALYWCASCGGCEEAIVDLAENILPVLEAVDIVFWPCAMDYKTADVEAMEDGSIAVSFVNGAVRTAEHEHMALLLRRKSKLIVACGSCACFGGIPALANLTSKRNIMDASYRTAPSVMNPAGTVPGTRTAVDGHELSLPRFSETVSRLNDVVDVDYYLPGCAPTPELVMQALTAILEGTLPPRGAILTPDRSLCSSCQRNETKPEDVAISAIKRVIEVDIDPDKCFLAQNVICMGPATRDGCGASCINGNMPCTGCFGPTDACRDQGGKMIATLGGIVAGDDAKTAARIIEGLADPAGTFYRYTLAGSLLGSARKEDS